MRNRSGMVIVLACGFCLAGCATITRGTVNQVEIVSEPPDAQVRTSLGHECRTPCTLTVDRQQDFTVDYSKPGFQDATVQVSTRVAGAGAAGLAGNLIVGGVVGLVADAATGASLEHYPNPVGVTLEPVAPARPAKGHKPAPRRPDDVPAAGGRSTIIAPET